MLSAYLDLKILLWHVMHSLSLHYSERQFSPVEHDLLFHCMSFLVAKLTFRLRDWAVTRYVHKLFNKYCTPFSFLSFFFKSEDKDEKREKSEIFIKLWNPVVGLLTIYLVMKFLCK